MSAPHALRVPPHSTEAEIALIGGILLKGSAFIDVSDAVSAEDFYSRPHRAIWGAIASLDAANRPIDMVALIDHLKSTGELEEAGGMAAIAGLVRDAAGSVNVRHYARIVREKALLRAAALAGMDIAQAAFAGGDPAEVVELAQTRVMEIGDSREGGPALIKSALPAWINTMEERTQAKGTLRGLPTGFSDFDALTLGLTPGQMVVVGARPSMGKTTLVTNIAEHVAVTVGKPVALFEMEMDQAELTDRMVSSLARVELDLIRRGDLTEEQWTLCTAATAKLSKAPLIVDDTPALTMAEISARARRIQKRHGLALVIIDYLQLIETKGSKGDNRTNEVTTISRDIKKLAKSLRVPVLVLSQLNRTLENRPNKRPQMSDLRESGAIEQDADIIAFIYRDEVYHEAGEKDARKGIAELIVAKQRNGRTGKVLLTAELARSRFHDCHHDSQARYGEAMKPKQENKPKPYAKGGFQ